MDETVSVDRVIKAPAAAIFAIVADASRHPDIDGSGSVKETKDDAPERLVLGSTFGMSMKLGVPYTVKNTVVEFEPDRRIAWQTTLAGRFGRFFGGRVWRYELAETPEGTTVTETWDITQDKQRFLLKRGPVGKQTADAMTKTLARLAELTETGGGATAEPPATDP
jgi:uncharacterized protein YndB with AHSA1/START domain